MLEPTWNQMGLGMRRGPAAPDRRKRHGASLHTLLEVAPYAVAAAWTAITLMAMLGSAVTGRRELLDWCRSDAVLTGAGALAALVALAGSLLKVTPSDR